MATALQIHRMYHDVTLPEYQTGFAACFDIRAYLPAHSVITVYDSMNCKHEMVAGAEDFIIHPGYRVLVPTGLIFVVPEGHSVRLHPRSGLSLKNGLVLANSEGVIDADYTEQVFVMITNVSHQSYGLQHDMRICQGEVVQDTRAEIVETVLKHGNPHPRKTNRAGGFGSTGR